MRSSFSLVKFSLLICSTTTVMQGEVLALREEYTDNTSYNAATRKLLTKVLFSRHNSVKLGYPTLDLLDGRSNRQPRGRTRHNTPDARKQKLKNKRSEDLFNEINYSTHNSSWPNQNQDTHLDSKSIAPELLELKDDTRIRKGLMQLTKANDKPYSVVLLVEAFEGSGICSGSLITLEWVLTAAFCLMETPITRIDIYAGGYSVGEWDNQELAEGSQALKGVYNYSHPWFTLDGFKSYYNIALVKTEKKFKSTRTVSTVKLSLKPWTFLNFETCETTSFGRIKLMQNRSLDYLRKTYYWKVKSPCKCLERDRKPDMWLCSDPLEGVGVCQGDIGAALVCQGEVRGVASLILPVIDLLSCDLNTEIESYECGHEKSFNIFQNTCHTLRWINSFVNFTKKEEIPKECGKMAESPIVDKQPSSVAYPSPILSLCMVEVCLLFIHILYWNKLLL